MSENLLTFDQILDALANYEVIVRPAKDEISIKNGNDLPVQVRLTMRYWQAKHPEARHRVMNYVCAIATGRIQELEEYTDPEYRAVIPDREKVVE